jgi:hypothetical protein
MRIANNVRTYLGHQLSRIAGVIVALSLWIVILLSIYLALT